MTRACLRLLLGSLIVLVPRAALAQAQDVVIYYHQDAVGSVRAITDANGNELQRYDYLPFGEPWPSTALPVQDPKRFTGQERDQETGLDYFGARYYSSQTGRFTTVDPGHVGGDIFDPQSWNGYAYALNNPLRFVDPLGMEPCQITLTGADAAAAGVEDGGTVQGECVQGKNPPAVNRRSWFAGAFSDVLDVFTGTAVVGARERGTADTWTPQEPTLNPYVAAAAGILVARRAPVLMKRVPVRPEDKELSLRSKNWRSGSC